MASITFPKLAIVRDRQKRTVRVTATCKVNFTTLELCQMKNCTGQRFFKLKCQLWGEDGNFFNGDHDLLFTYPECYYFPDITPTAIEDGRFDQVIGEGVLDEDLGTDEIFALFKLTNIYTMTSVMKKSNLVSDSF